MRKRWLFLLLIGVLAVQSGCAPAGDDSDAAYTNANVPTLTWVVPGEPQPDMPLVMAHVNTLIEPAIGVKLDLQFIDSASYEERLQMKLASGETFDLCFVGYLYSYASAVGRSAVLPLADLIENNAPGLKDLIPEYAWQAATIKNEIYCVPNVQMMASSSGLAIRQDLRDKYSLDTAGIQRLTDIEPFLRQIRDNEAEVYPSDALIARDFAPNDKNYESFYAELIFLDAETARILPYYEYPNIAEYAQTLHEWYDKGYLRKDIVTAGDAAGDRMAGRYATYTVFNKPGVAEEERRAKGYAVDVIPLNKPYMGSADPLATTTAISVTSRYPEAAIRLIEMVNRDEALYNAICYGIEGKHYQKIAENRVEPLETEGYSLPQSAWKFGNQFNAWLIPGQSDDVWERTRKMNDEAVKSPILGLVLKQDNIKVELAQCIKIQLQYVVSVFNVGAEDPRHYWAEYVNALQEAGIDKIVADMQRQVNEFLAAAP